MKLGTHMPDSERKKPIDIEVCRTKVKVVDVHRSNLVFLIPDLAHNFK
jgi:hypothetical protein